MAKFHNPTEYLVSFNMAKKMVGGFVVPNWVNIEKGSYLVTDDEETIKQAGKHNAVNRAMEGLKGYLVEVKDDATPVEKTKKSK